MAVVGDFALQRRDNQQFEQVVEPELDMNRIRPRQSALSRLFEILRWLTPAGHQVVGPPRRSVGRELEEAWPSGER